MPTYNQPEYEEDDWHLPLNENFDDIGTDIDDLDSRKLEESDLDDATVEEATFWDGYELVFDDEIPSTDTYIRFETE